MSPRRLVAATALSLGLLVAPSPARHRRPQKLPEPVARPHALTQPVDYGWIYQAFEGHPFLRLASVDQENHKLPGKAVAEIRLHVAQPEMLVRKEIQRLTMLGVAPDRRLRHITYVVRGLGDIEWGVLIGFWKRGDAHIRWDRPRGPEGAR